MREARYQAPDKPAMPPRAHRLSDADRALWENYTSQLVPLRGRVPRTAVPVKQPRPPAPGQPEPDAPPSALPPAPAVRPAKPPGAAALLAVGTQPGGIDKATWQRFRSGKLATVRTLDLHGMTAQRAFQALVSFLHTAHAEQIRCVEVVTGRGSGETGGVLRREFPHWLNLPNIRPLILGAAHPHALNSGSVRLFLRRIR